MLSQKGFIKVGKCGLPFPNHIPANNLLQRLNLNGKKRERFGNVYGMGRLETSNANDALFPSQS